MNGTTTGTAPSRLSRETRRLLTAAGLALLMLWTLARVRFPDRPTSPIAPVLTQLSSPTAFDELAAEVGRLQTRLARSVAILPEGSPGAASTSPRRVAVRLDEDAAVTYIQPAVLEKEATGPDIVAVDAVTGLAIVSTSAGQSGPALVPWLPEEVDEPRYFLAALPGDGGVFFIPAFVSGLRLVAASGWSGPVWQILGTIDLPVGSLLFTSNGEFAGLLVQEAGTTAIVPAETLMSDARRLEARGRATAGELGILTRPMTPALASATGAGHGVVVVWVTGPAAAARVAVGDVIESVNGESVTSSHVWANRTRGLLPGDKVELGLRRAGEPRKVALVAAAPVAQDPNALGLTLRLVPAVGSEVVRIEPGSAAGRAGVTSGDFITALGSSTAPAPAEIHRAFSQARSGQAILLGIDRGGTHDVVAVTK